MNKNLFISSVIIIMFVTGIYLIFRQPADTTEITETNTTEEVVANETKQDVIVETSTTTVKLDETAISNFQECIDAGYQAMESYPMQCATPKGEIFIQNINMTQEEALNTANASDVCTEEGEIGAFEGFNENSQTWWFELSAEKQGCTPACVVSELDNSVEINWRCTGLLLPE